MSSPAIRFIASKRVKVPTASLQLLCRVKPGASTGREGISAVSDHAIELCVAARAKDGEANKAVRAVIAEALNLPKTDIQIVRGMKSREKTLLIGNISLIDTAEEHVERIKATLQESTV